MAKSGGVNGVAVIIVLAGGILAYSGVRGKGISATVRALLSGQNPSDLATTQVVLTSATSAVGGSAGTDPGTTTTAENVGGTGNINTIATALAQLGLNRAGQAAFIGNWIVESGLDPAKPNPGEGAIGLGQWEGGRRTGLQAYAASKGLKETDLAAQLGWAQVELTTAYAPVLAQVIVATSPNTAASASAGAAIVDEEYEISTGVARQQRENDAATVFGQLA